MSLLDTILSGVGAFGNALDTPGAIVRNSLAGRNPFTGLNPFDAEGRASGRDVLETWGMLDPNEEGLDFGDVAGFGAEMLTDPLNLLGAGALKHAFNSRRAYQAANEAADAAVAGAKAHNLSVDQAFSAAADARRIHDDARIFSRTGLVEGRPDITVDLLKVPDELSAAYDKIGASGLGQTLTHAEKLRLLHGTQDDAAEMAGKLTGYPITQPHPAVAAMYRDSGTRPYGIDIEAAAAANKPARPWEDAPDIYNGFVLRDRPDLSFVRSTGTLPQQIGTGAHEAVHALSAMYPDHFEWGVRYPAGGRGVANRYMKTLNANDQEQWLFDSLARHPDELSEEAIASEIGNAVIRGTPQQRFPVIDNAFVGGGPMNPPDAGVIDELASLLSRKGIFDEPRDMAGEVLSFLKGHTRQKHALVPTGRGSQFNPYKSFADAPSIPDTSGLSYLPVDRPYIPVPAGVDNINPLLAALLGHNAMTGYSRAQ